MSKRPIDAFGSLHEKAGLLQTGAEKIRLGREFDDDCWKFWRDGWWRCSYAKDGVGVTLSESELERIRFLAPFARVELHVGSDAAPAASMPAAFFNRHAGLKDTGTVAVWRDDESNAHWFRYRDGCLFRITDSGDCVRAYSPPEMSVEDLHVYLYGPIMGFALRLQGVVSLHASAVLLSGETVAFVGTGGAGKSTLAARFALSGIPVVTDDVLPVQEEKGEFFVRPSVPQIKLWPEAVAQLYGRPDALPKLVPSSPDWDKRFLDLTQPGMALAEGHPPLGVVYLLQPRSTTTAFPQIEPVSPAEGLVALITHSYVNYALSKEMREHEFKVLSRLVQTVPVRRLTLPETMGDLGMLTDLVKEDMARSARSTSQS